MDAIVVLRLIDCNIKKVELLQLEYKRYTDLSQHFEEMLDQKERNRG